MDAMQASVAEFREKFKLPITDTPGVLTVEEAALHINMIRDEFENELVPALLSGDILEIYDAGIDVLYYLLGMFTHAGLDVEPGFYEVHRSNMSKLHPETGEAIFAVEGDGSGEPAGKVLKGPGYFKPNLTLVLQEQGVKL